MTFEPLIPLDTTSNGSSSSGTPATPQQFEQELPLADDDGVRSSGEDNKVAIPDDVFFPEIDLNNNGDDVFMQELLDFARISDEDL